MPIDRSIGQGPLSDVERLSIRNIFTFFNSNLLNSTFLCAQAMTHARGLYKPQATSEHDLHIKRFVSEQLVCGSARVVRLLCDNARVLWLVCDCVRGMGHAAAVW